MGTKIDYTGKRFGKLYVDGESKKRGGSGNVMWDVTCDCGNKKAIRISKSRPAMSCGCLQKEAASKANFKDISGIRFGITTAMFAMDKRSASGSIMWSCICDCGNEHVTSANNLRGGSAKSCGCYGKRRRLESTIRHGMSSSVIYHRWEQIIQRCTNQNSSGYDNYGGRGVTVCDEWLSFDGFYLDMGDIPWVGATIDRIDNDNGYCKGNCEWADMSTQLTNQRSSNKHGWKGVDKYGNKYRYRVVRKDKTYTKAGFDTAKDAGMAYIEKKKEIYNR